MGIINNFLLSIVNKEEKIIDILFNIDNETNIAKPIITEIYIDNNNIYDVPLFTINHKEEKLYCVDEKDLKLRKQLKIFLNNLELSVPKIDISKFYYHCIDIMKSIDAYKTYSNIDKTDMYYNITELKDSTNIKKWKVKIYKQFVNYINNNNTLEITIGNKYSRNTFIVIE